MASGVSRADRLLAAALVFAAVVGHAAAVGTSQDTPPLPEDVDAVTTILRAEDRRDASNDLVALAESENPVVRARVALALGRIGLPRSLPLLLEALRDPQPEVRSAAAFALGKLELDLSPATEDALRLRAVEGLVVALPDHTVAPAAAWALGQMGIGPARDAVAALLPAALRGDLPPPVSAALLDAWWRFPGATAEVAAGASRSGAVAVRLAAAHALRRLDDPNAQPELLALLGDADSRVRAQAVRGLRNSPLALAEERAPRLLQDRDWRVSVEALAWLAAAWSRALADEDRREKIGDGAVGEVVRMSLDRNLHVRRMSLHALGILAADWAVGRRRLLEALDDKEASVRIVALNELVRAEAAGDALDSVRERYGLDDPRAASVDGVGPLESAAVVRMLAAAGVDADEGFLRRVARGGDLPTRAAALRAMTAADGNLLAEEIDAAFASGHPALAGVAAEKISELVADGTLGQIPAPEVGWGGYLWARQASLSAAEALEPRLLTLSAIEDVNSAMLQGRRSVLIADDNRVVRIWAARRAVAGGGPQGTALGPVGAEEVMATAAQPQETGRDEAAYRELALQSLARQASPPILEVTTSRGSFAIELDARAAPLTVDAVLEWVRGGAYEGVGFHRVVPGFVIQGGDSTATGYGGAAPTLRNEDSPIDYVTGTVGIALAGRDTGSSQWFVTHAPQPNLTGLYPVLGRVVEGQRVVDRVQPGDIFGVRLRETQR